jgi:hypothetical protein
MPTPDSQALRVARTYPVLIQTGSRRPIHRLRGSRGSRELVGPENYVADVWPAVSPGQGQLARIRYGLRVGRLG